MPTFRILKSGRINCQIRKQGRKTLTRTFDSEKEARAWAAIEECKRYRVQVSRNLVGFRDIGQAYVGYMLGGKPSQYQTHRRVERMSKHFTQPITDISKWDVHDYKLLRMSQVGSSTCRDEILLLRRVVNWANRELIVKMENPCVEISLPRASKPRTKVITPQELKLILENVSEPMRTVIEIAYETAMRRSEILKLTPACLDLENRILDVIDGKTGDRTVPLTSRAVELLREAEAGCLHPSSRLFPFSAYGVSQALRRARIKLGLSSDIRFHQLRHTRISIVAKKGFNQAQIMMVSGHKDSRSVQRYTHLNVTDVIDLLD